MNTNKILKPAVIIVGFLLILYFFISEFLRLKIHNLIDRFEKSGHPVDEIVIPPREVHPIYPTNYSKDEVLMGSAHHVFVGKITKQIGKRPISSIPATQFEAEVVYNIKGNLEGNVIVEQQGGYVGEILYVISGGDIKNIIESFEGYLLEPGNTYLIASRYNSKDDWHTMMSYYGGHKLINQNNNLNKSQLQEISRDNARVKELEEAYKNEVLLEADIRSNNTLNSYESIYGNINKQ
jgi:hypothetical protein